MAKLARPTSEALDAPSPTGGLPTLMRSRSLGAERSAAARQISRSLGAWRSRDEEVPEGHDAEPAPPPKPRASTTLAAKLQRLVVHREKKPEADSAHANEVHAPGDTTGKPGPSISDQAKGLMIEDANKDDADPTRPVLRMLQRKMDQAKQLLKVKTALLAKEAESTRKQVLVAVQFAEDLVVILSGGASLAAQGMVKTFIDMATAFTSVGAQVKADLDLAKALDTIDKMNASEVDAQLEKVGKSITQFKELAAQLGPATTSMLNQVVAGASGNEDGAAARAANAGVKGWGLGVKGVAGANGLRTGEAKNATDVAFKEAQQVNKLNKYSFGAIGQIKDKAKELGKALPLLGTALAAISLYFTERAISKLRGQVEELEKKLKTPG